jgi:hypothetical protein
MRRDGLPLACTEGMRQMANYISLAAPSGLQNQEGSGVRSALPVPFDLDERIVYIFRHNLVEPLRKGDLTKLSYSLEGRQAQIDFTQGLVKGVYRGARLVVEEYVKSTIEMLEKLVNWTLEFYSTVYDPSLWRGYIRKVLFASNTADRTTAVNELADLYSTRHPAGSAALLSLAETWSMLEALVEWLGQKDVVAVIVEALSRDLADLLRDELANILALTGQPEKQGLEVGNAVGQVTMQLALLILGV